MHPGKLFGAVVLGELRDTWKEGPGGAESVDQLRACMQYQPKARRGSLLGLELQTVIPWVDAGNQTLVLGKSRQCF